MKTLLLSAYAAQSHVYWASGLQQMFPTWNWTALELPPRYFSWRVRGNPLIWSLTQRELLEQHWDLLVATSMVDLATLRGLVPALASVPTLLYFHENQFDYPQHRQQHSLLEAQMVSLYSALAADRIAFNSAFNRDSFIDGCSELLGRLPDQVPAGIPQSLMEKSVVLPVPLLPQLDTQPKWPAVTQGDEAGRPLRILWSARFEHDKGGEGLYHILRELEERGLSYEIAVTGQQFRNSPPIFATIEEQFSHRLVQFGYVESAQAYQAMQRAADIVLSTAVHEFQGLAILQAVRAGCTPIVPDRLAYRELYAAKFRYQSLPDQPAQEATAAAALIENMANRREQGIFTAPDVAAFELSAMKTDYARQFEVLLGWQDSQ